MYKVLTIAGSDCSGGAGIQADIKTITAHKMYAMSVITALTAQNTTGVSGVYETTPEFVEQQMDMVFSDIVPDAVKIGMVSNRNIILSIAKKLREFRPRAVVLDPVMVSTSGSRLLQDDAVDALTQELMPLATVITPNIPEAECFTGITINNEADMEKAAKRINEFYAGGILIKGGHFYKNSDDLLWFNRKALWFRGEKVDNSNTHGTGCTLSSAIACGLAAGNSLETSVRSAKAYITGALRANLNLGSGSGPLNHCWQM